jgi:hypothetical protein
MADTSQTHTNSKTNRYHPHHILPNASFKITHYNATNQASAEGSVIGYEEKMTTQGMRVPTCGAEHITWYADTNPMVTFYSLNQPTLI